jgi:hypothetical protein
MNFVRGAHEHYARTWLDMNGKQWEDDFVEGCAFGLGDVGS